MKKKVFLISLLSISLIRGMEGQLPTCSKQTLRNSSVQEIEKFYNIASGTKNVTGTSVLICSGLVVYTGVNSLYSLYNGEYKQGFALLGLSGATAYYGYTRYKIYKHFCAETKKIKGELELRKLRTLDIDRNKKL